MPMAGRIFVLPHQGLPVPPQHYASNQRTGASAAKALPIIAEAGRAAERAAGRLGLSSGTASG
jgi:hypothetical protein